jgi:hypothetical protein
VRDVLHCTTGAGVLKELTVFVILYNLIRRVMAAAAARQKVAVERISFIDAWRWLQQAEPSSALPKMFLRHKDVIGRVSSGAFTTGTLVSTISPFAAARTIHCSSTARRSRNPPSLP